MNELELLVPREVRLEMYKELLEKLIKKEITPKGLYGLFICNNLVGMLVEYIEDKYGPFEYNCLGKYSTLEVFPELLLHKPKYIDSSTKMLALESGAWFRAGDYKGREKLLRKVIKDMEK